MAKVDISQMVNKTTGHVVAPITIYDAVVNPNSKKTLDVELSELNAKISNITEGSSYQVFVQEGDGVGKKTLKSLIASNLTKPFNYRITAVTDVVYTSSDGNAHTFVGLGYVPAGVQHPISNVYADHGNIGDSYSAGQLIAEGVWVMPDTFTAYDMYIRYRMSGTVKVEFFEGSKDMSYDEVKEQVASNTEALKPLANIPSRVSTLENKIPALEISLNNINQKFEGHDNSQIFYTVGQGSTDKTWEKIFTNVTTVGPVKIIAETDIIYTGTSESTFISYAFIATGTSVPPKTPAPIIESERGIGKVFPAGTVIIDHLGTPLPYASDIYIGARYSGTLKIVYPGEVLPGLEDQVKENTSTINLHDQRIKKLETGGEVQEPSIITLYNQQIQRARQLGYRSEASKSIYPIKPLSFMHISDTHTSKPNTRAIQILNYLGVNGFVKFLMHTGDMLEDPKRNPPAWSNIVAAAQYPVFVTSGNHDVGNWDTSPSKYKTDSQFYDFFVAPQISAWGLKTDGNGNPHPSGKNYYFTDFTEEKIRFIVVYEYEIPSVSSQTDAGRGARWISQEQTDWFVNTLYTTPAGYGVIVAKHAPDGLIGDDKNPFNSPFRDNENTQQTFQYKDGASYTAFFADIVQAFINRQSINYTVSQSAASYQGTLNVAADFRNVATGAEFICFVSGHVHADNITRIETHPQILELNINCDNTIINNQRSETLLIEGTTFEDAINVYCIDRNQGLIHVLRIGADYSGNGDRKDMLTVSYK